MNQRVKLSTDLSTKEIDHLLSIFPTGLVGFDLEMTGLSPFLDKIIEIAAIKITPSGIETFHELINPLITIPEHTIKFHQITNEMVRHKSTLKEPLKQFRDFYQDLPLIAHNAQFDAGYLIRAHHEYGLSPGKNEIYDSCKFARLIYKKNSDAPDNFKLGTLAQYLNIDFTHHQALDDAVCSLKVFDHALKRLQDNANLKNLKTYSYLFKLSQFKKSEDYILPKKLDQLREWVPERKEILIDYSGVNRKGERPVKAISLMPMPQGLILYGLCLQSNMNKTYLIRKIKGVRLKDE